MSASPFVSQAPPPARAGAPSRREPKATFRRTNGTPMMSSPTNEKDNTKLQGKNHNQAFSSGRRWQLRSICDSIDG